MSRAARLQSQMRMRSGLGSYYPDAPAVGAMSDQELAAAYSAIASMPYSERGSYEFAVTNEYFLRFPASAAAMVVDAPTAPPVLYTPTGQPMTMPDQPAAPVMTATAAPAAPSAATPTAVAPGGAADVPALFALPRPVAQAAASKPEPSPFDGVPPYVWAGAAALAVALLMGNRR